MKTPTTFIALAALVGAAALLPTTARAGIDACGNIDVSAEAQCEVVVEGGCEVQCEPIAFEAACAGRLYAECEGECNAEISVDCQASCTGECNAECEVDPPAFSCEAGCEADCSAECSGRCSSGDSECEASCRGTCSGSCEANCEGTPPEASCEGKCEASCQGSCEGEANIDCQVECQAGGYIDCKAELSGGCEADCRSPEGALFCDGQYVDHGNNLQECIAALEAAYDIDVQGQASCEGNSCEASGSVSCAVDPDASRTAWGSGCSAPRRWSWSWPPAAVVAAPDRVCGARRERAHRGSDVRSRARCAPTSRSSAWEPSLQSLHAMRTPAALRTDVMLRTLGLQPRRSVVVSVMSGMSLLSAGIIIGASLGLLFGTRGGAEVRRTVRRAARNVVGSRPPRPGKHVADARDSAYGASDYGVRVSPAKA